MAYGYRRRGRAAYRKRPAYRKRAKGTNWGSVAQRALKTAKFVAGLINVEKKFYDVNVVGNFDNTGYQVFTLNNFAQGDDENQRNGRSVLSKTLQLRGTLKLQSATDYGTIRFVLIRDKAASGTTPTMTDIYNTATTDSAVTSFRNILTGAAQRYDILWDKRYTLDKDQKGSITVEKYWKLNSHIHFVGTGNATADLGNGSLYMAVISTGTSASNTGMDFTGVSRLRYIDN